MGGQVKTDLRESLRCLGYPQNDENFIEAVTTDQVKFSVLVSWLSNELSSATHGVVDKVTSLEDVDNEDSFNLEVSSLLTALHCPYKDLVRGNWNQRLESERNKIILLEFLSSEVQAARIVEKSADAKRMRREQRGSTQSRNALLLVKSLGLPVPRQKIDLEAFFDGIQKQITTLQPKPSTPLISKKLGPAEWSKLQRVYQKLLNDFTIRRMALLKRLDVTIQSFGWSSRMEDKQAQITRVYMPCRQSLMTEPSVQFGDVLAARPDVLIIDKTSCAKVREKTQTSVAKVIMGSVPDRGGRATDMAPPPPEMPSWSKRRAAPNDQGGRGRGGGFGRGGQGGRQGQESNYGQQQNRGGDAGYHQGGAGGGGHGRVRHNQDQQQYHQRNDGYGQGGDGYGHQRDYGYDQGSDGYHQGNGGGASGYYDNRGRRDHRQQHGEYNTGRVADAGWQENRREGQRGAYRGSYRGGRGHNRY